MSDMTQHHSAAQRAEQIAEAERRCAAASESLTPLRRRVLELLIDQPGPAKAYDLLPLLDGEKQAKPPTIYRALDFLVRMGLAHRIESLNAFVACDIGACARSTIFLICEGCGGAVEFDAGHALVDLSDAAKKDGFSIRRTMIEASGLCGACQAAALAIPRPCPRRSIRAASTLGSATTVAISMSASISNGR
jgi:Fur family zinc uptake transcriptional regulator